MIKKTIIFLNKRLKSIYNKYQWNRIKNNYELIDLKQKLFSKNNPTDINFSSAFFYDEYSKEINKYFSFKNIQPKFDNKYLITSPDSLLINSQKSDGENWPVFKFNLIQDNYCVEFDYKNSITIHEFQLAVNYKNIKERNRFLIIENEIVLFDCIKNGIFFPILFKKKISNIFNYEGINHIKLISYKGLYALYVNDNCLLAIKEKEKICKGNSVAFILWEDFHNRPISCNITNLKISTLI